MTGIGNELLGKLRKMRMIADDDDEAVSSGPSKGQPTQQPAWMRQLFDRCKEWHDQLPQVRIDSFSWRVLGANSAFLAIWRPRQAEL